MNDFHRALAAAFAAVFSKEDVPVWAAFDLGDRPPVALTRQLDLYEDRLRQGLGASMDYLRRGAVRRRDPRLVFSSARSLVTIAWPYERLGIGLSGAAEQSCGSGREGGPWFSRYLDGPDYHSEIPARLERVMAHLKAEVPSLSYKICVDSSAVFEKGWAALGGLGWVGKNSLLIHPRYGSFLFLAEILLSEAVGISAPDEAPEIGSCGNCRRCLDACPSGALIAPGVLDARRCISYRTLENRAAGLGLPVQGAERDRGAWVAGCDGCQDVCPYNRKRQILPPPPDALGPSRPRHPLTLSWAAALAETSEQTALRFRGTALARMKPEQYRRNLAVAARNAGIVAQD